jgi:ABC-type multidrug transport system fused ATPase/permease subunit
VLFAVVAIIMAVTIPLYKKTQARQDELLLSTRENLTGARVLRAFCKEEEEISSFDKKNSALVKSQNIVGIISALMNPLTYVLINAGIILLLYVGAIRVDAGNLTQGQVLALYNYMSQILVELIKLANLIVTITKALACANRIEKVFDLNSPLQHNDDTTVHTQNAVDFENVSLSYNGGGNALEGITFSVKKGETVGVIGGTGSGKSSLVNLIPHFYDATVGRVLVDGVDVKAQNTEELREKVGVVLQKAVRIGRTHRTERQEPFGRTAATALHCSCLGERSLRADLGRQRVCPRLCDGRRVAEVHLRADGGNYFHRVPAHVLFAPCR